MTVATSTCHFQVTFAATAEEAADVRRLVIAHLHFWGHPEVVDGAVLATGELFANAVEHGSKSRDDTVTVTLDCEAGHLRITVADSSPVLPRPRGLDPLAEHGRGLAIVDGICEKWGAEVALDGSGKQVWCTMRVGSIP
jgi:anti-sigma regulatory factor (Ser/Thr protein kinase)